MASWSRVLLLPLLLGLSAGCGGSGRPSGSSSGPSVPESLTVTSAVWTTDRPIGPPYGCARNGDRGTSPPVSWTAAPDARYYAITVIDPDAHDFVHWAALNLPATTTELPAGASGALPAPAQELRNTFGGTGYAAPCPPPGQTHHYVLTVYALRDKATGLGDLSTVAVATGRLTTTYRR